MGRETKKCIFLSSSCLSLMGLGSSSLEILQVAHEQTQAPCSWGLLLPKGAAEFFLKYTG